MADTQISAPGGPTTVTIPEHEDAGRRQTVLLQLTPETAEEYGVWQKDFPANIPTTFDEQSITWVNNFGFKPSGSESYAATVPAYTATLDVEEGETLVAYDPQREPALWQPQTEVVNGQVRVTLDGGDPAVGWVG